MDGRREATSRNHSRVRGVLYALKGSENISVQAGYEAADKQRQPAGLQGGSQGVLCWCVDREACLSGESQPPVALPRPTSRPCPRL